MKRKKEVRSKKGRAVAAWESMKRRAAVFATGAAGLGASAGAMAQSGVEFDSTEALATIASAQGFITTVGLAVIGLVVLAKVIGLGKRAG